MSIYVAGGPFSVHLCSKVSIYVAGVHLYSRVSICIAGCPFV